jgi:acetyltransferase
MIASATPEQYERTVAELLQSDALDTLLVIYVPPVVTTPEEVSAAISRAVSRDHRKTVAACFMTYGDERHAIETADGGKVPSFDFPENAVRALAQATDYGRFRSEPEGHVPRFPNIRTGEARAIVDGAAGGGWLYPEDSLRLLDCYGIPVALTKVALSAVEAAAAAKEIGFPVAMKLRSRSVTHKTEVKGVRLGLMTESEVESAFRDMAAGMESAGMSSAMEGVIVQAMSAPVQEVVLGMSRDQVFGPMVMAGLGGTLVEMFRDVSFSLHPLTDADPARMLGRLKSLPLLQGWRGAVPGDVDALKDVMLRFSAMITDLPQLETIEINPLMILPEGRGCVAVDARALTGSHNG